MQRSSKEEKRCRTQGVEMANGATAPLWAEGQRALPFRRIVANRHECSETQHDELHPCRGRQGGRYEQDQHPPRDQKGPHHRHARRARAMPRRACGAPTLIKRLISAGTTEVGDLPFLEIAAEPLVLSTLLGHSLKV